jgi:hypothetical protein
MHLHNDHDAEPLSTCVWKGVSVIQSHPTLEDRNWGFPFPSVVAATSAPPSPELHVIAR